MSYVDKALHSASDGKNPSPSEAHGILASVEARGAVLTVSVSGTSSASFKPNAPPKSEGSSGSAAAAAEAEAEFGFAIV